MKKRVFYICAAVSSLLLTGLSRAENPAAKEELSRKDLTIIENLDFFENFEMLEEDSVLMEEYDSIDKINSLGDDHE